MKKSQANYVDAPVIKGQKLGELKVYSDGNLVKEVNMIAADDVDRCGIIRHLVKMFAETYLL